MLTSLIVDDLSSYESYPSCLYFSILFLTRYWTIITSMFFFFTFFIFFFMIMTVSVFRPPSKSSLSGLLESDYSAFFLNPNSTGSPKFQLKKARAIYWLWSIKRLISTSCCRSNTPKPKVLSM